jgi:NADH-quinone oxidoreductase subunit G
MTENNKITTDNRQHTTDIYMPKLVIDDREIEVAPGTKVIEAAEELGIMIPRFCYHPALGSVGACRVCAVKFLQGPFKGVQMSCMVEAQDGMVVSTTDKEAVDFRKYVIEWLMLHHPHDCPVCDEGGHCLLQDMTVAGGHGIRRYLGNKRTYADQYLGPLLQHEMNRCIHCYRCARFYQEFSGYRDLGAMQNANRTYFGRFKDGVLESPFAGNLSDICPTGVYTDKPSRFFGRRWDYERSPSLCMNCSLGCHTVVSCRYRKVVRQEARFSKSVNGYFICDRGRYGFFYAGLEQRPRRAIVDGEAVAVDQAVDALKQRLKTVKNRVGAQAVTCAGSSRSSLETLAMLKRVCQANGWPPPAYFADTAITRKVKSAVARLDSELVVSLREIESADFIAVLGADAINEAPMLALAMRQARRDNAAVAVIDPRPIFLPFEFEHLPAKLDEVNGCLGALIKTAIDPAVLKEQEAFGRKFYADLPPIEQLKPSQQEKVSFLAEKLRTSQRPIIVCATETVRQQTPALAADAALLLQAAGKQAGLFYLMPGANAFAAGLLSDETASFEALIGEIEKGSIKGLILVESNPFWNFPDRQRLEKAMGHLDLLVVMDYMNSEAAQNAHIFLPTTTMYESGGVYINQEARVQVAQPAYRGGMPITLSGGGNHPPRAYDTGNPDNEPASARQLLAYLIDDGLGKQPAAKDLQAGIWTWLTETEVGLKNLGAIEEIPDEGVRLYREPDFTIRFLNETPSVGPVRDDRLELITVERAFGTEELSSCSECLSDLVESLCIFMCRTDAKELNLAAGDKVSVELHGGTLDVNLRIADNMAAGTLVIPRYKALEWQKMGTGQKWIRKDRIRKVGQADNFFPE